METSIIGLINQIFEIEKKSLHSDLHQKIRRNLKRIKTYFENLGYYFHNPIGEAYDLSRLDCEASIAGEPTQHLKITEVIKPIIYFRADGQNTIIQRGVVVVERE